MPKEIITKTLERKGTNQNWGFVVIGGKDQAITIKVGKVRPLTPAETAGLMPCDYIWQINGKECFEMSHDKCVEEIKKAGNSLSLAVERGDHIVPNFEEIWPSKKKLDELAKKKNDKEWGYYYDAMQNGPGLSGHMPIPTNFTTVGKPQICVNQYDSPIQVYSEDTIKEMAENKLIATNPEYAERAAAAKGAQPGGLTAGSNGQQFDAKNSNVMGLIGAEEKSRGQ